MSRCGPRRLTKPMLTPPAAGRRLRRKGAGDASCALDKGRNMKNSVSPHCAARCSRRRLSLRAWFCHNNKAPQLPLRKTCSAAHKVSALRVLRIQTSWDGGKPSAASASACGAWGGCSSTMRREAAAASAGRSRRSSPMPVCWSSRSIRVPVGQPPPGSWLDRVGWPVSTQRALEWASCDARQSEGWRLSGVGWR